MCRPRSETRWDSAPCGVTSYAAQQPSPSPCGALSTALTSQLSESGTDAQRAMQRAAVIRHHFNVSHCMIYFYRWWWNILLLPGAKVSRGVPLPYREVRVHTGTGWMWPPDLVSCSRTIRAATNPRILTQLHLISFSEVTLSSLRLNFVHVGCNLKFFFLLWSFQGRVTDRVSASHLTLGLAIRSNIAQKLGKVKGIVQHFGKYNYSFRVRWKDWYWSCND